uniref:CASP-like protein n=1 Tax=Oryza meridionalis TaxID=40149 RepID=A0A0E0D7F0_9ORYZ
MGKGFMSYLAMKTDAAGGEAAQAALIDADLQELGVAARKLANHALVLGGGLGFGTTFLKWLAFFAAVYLLILDRTNWKTNMLTALLVPYIFFTLPGGLFSLLRGEIGKWIAIIAVILRLFFPRHFPDWLELPGAVILLIAVAPNLFASTFRGDLVLVGIFICLIIGCYLLQEHIRASGGFRNAFRKGNGVSNSIGILLLFIYPVWALNRERAGAGAVGSAGSLGLRVGQAVFSSASLLFMSVGVEFFSYTAFCFLVTIMGLVIPWSCTLAMIDVYSILVGCPLRVPGIMVIVVIGDWVLAILSLAAASSSAAVIDLLLQFHGSHCSPRFCGRYQLSAMMAFLSWFLTAASSLFNLWFIASR